MSQRKKADDINVFSNLDLGQHADSLGDMWEVKYTKKNVCMISKKHTKSFFADEAVMKDEHDNYVFYAKAMLSDGETYEWKDWIRPSVCDLVGGGFLTDGVLQMYRRKSADAFAMSEKAIKQSEKVIIYGDS